MRVSKRILVIGITFLSCLCLARWADAQDSDQAIADRALGPQWRQLSRRAGMIFAGTVLTDTGVAGGRQGTALRLTGFNLRVDRAISGVENGEIVAVHEWAGAAAKSMYRPVHPGQHVLIFLYPLSRLGLTSPVGGALGRFAIDASGTRASALARERDSSEQEGNMIQLERAIRSAREAREE